MVNEVDEIVSGVSSMVPLGSQEDEEQALIDEVDLENRK